MLDVGDESSVRPRQLDIAQRSVGSVLNYTGWFFCPLL